MHVVKTIEVFVNGGNNFVNTRAESCLYRFRVTELRNSKVQLINCYLNSGISCGYTVLMNSVFARSANTVVPAGL